VNVGGCGARLIAAHWLVRVILSPSCLVFLSLKLIALSFVSIDLAPQIIDLRLLAAVLCDQVSVLSVDSLPLSELVLQRTDVHPESSNFLMLLLQ